MKLKQEVWQQVPDDPELWLGECGVLLNKAALEERAHYFDVVRVPVAAPEYVVGATLEKQLGHAG